MNWRISNRLSEILLTGALLFGPLAFGAVEPWSLAALSMLVFAALFFCALKGLPNLSLPIYRTFLPAVLIILLTGLIQLFNAWSIHGPATLVPFTVSAYATSRALMLWAMYAAVLWCVPQVFTDLPSVRRLMTTVFGLGCLISIIGIIQMSQNRLMIYGLRSVPYGYEPFGPYYNRDHAASMLSMAAFCGMGLIWDGFISNQRKVERADVFNFAAVQSIIFFGVGITLVGVLCTLSRGALVSVLIAGLVLGIAAVWSAKYRLVWFALVAVGVLAATVLSPIAARLTYSYIGAAVSFRVGMYRAGLELFRDFPWFGTGLGAFQHSYYLYQPKTIVGIVEHAHGDWLEILLQVGIFGLIVYLMGLGRFVFRSVSALLHPSRRSIRGLAYGIGASILVFLLHQLVEFAFQIPANAVLFLMMLALVSALSHSGERSLAEGLPRHHGKIRGAIAVIALTLFFISACPAVAFWYAQKGKAGPTIVRGESLAQAIKWDSNPRYYDDLAIIQASLPTGMPEVRMEKLRQALVNSEAALLRDSSNARFRERVVGLLGNLGRAEDGRSLAGLK